MAVEVTFCIHTRARRCVPEEIIANEFAAWRPTLLGKHQGYGAILIRAPGQPAVDVDDELWALVQNLCFLPIPDLLAAHPVDIPYFRYADTFRLEPIGDKIRISGGMLPEAEFPGRPLLDGLYDCGRRFIALLRRLGDDARHGDTIVLLENASVRAAAALDAC